MNFFYIIAHDEKKLRTNLDHVDQALNDLILNHQSKTKEKQIENVFSSFNRRFVLSLQMINSMLIVMALDCYYVAFSYIFSGNITKLIKLSIK